jgi:hypothetical protein
MILFLRACGGIMRDGEEPPALRAGLEVVGRDIAACTRKVAA